jgi:hypothetical protein
MCMNPVSYRQYRALAICLLLLLISAPLAGHATAAEPVSAGPITAVNSRPPLASNPPETELSVETKNSSPNNPSSAPYTCAVSRDDIAYDEATGKEAITALLSRLNSNGSKSGQEEPTRCARYLTGQLRSAGYFLSEIVKNDCGKNSNPPCLEYRLVIGQIERIILSQSGDDKTSSRVPKPELICTRELGAIKCPAKTNDSAVDSTAFLIADRLATEALSIGPTRFADVEKMLLLIQDIGGLSISSVVRRIEPEKKSAPDSNRLFELEIVYVLKPTSQFVNLDNAGSSFSGPWQMSAGIAFDAVSDWITRVDLAAVTTLNREQNYGQFGVSRLFGQNGFNLRLQAGYGETRPTGDLGVAGFRSEVLNLSLQASYPLKRSRAENLTLRGGLELLHSDIGITGLEGGRVRLSESHLRIARVAGQWSLVHGTGLTSIEFEGAAGLDFAAATPNNSTLSARPSSRSDFRKISGRAVRRQGLDPDSDDFSSFDLTTSLSGQYAFDVLPPSQKFLLGGIEGARGFYYGQLSGDHGLVVTTELTYRLSARIWSRDSWRTFGVFYDYATAWDIAAFDPPRRQLQSVGALYREEIDVGSTDEPAKLLVGITAARRLTRDPTQTNAALLPQHRLIGSFLVRL